MTQALRTRGYLPHLENQDPTYFVTFRLADSVPRELLERIRLERLAIENAVRAGTAVPADQDRLAKLKATIQKVEHCLDEGLGACHMRDSRVARIVADALKHFDGQRYHLLAWCVMPNHVHVVFSPLAPHTLDHILHSWKSFSSEQANRYLGRSGRFWQREYFDHLVRSEASLMKIVDYVKRNPEKAGLRNWPWVEVMS